MASGSKTKEATAELNNDLSKIQEILFGHQVKQFEMRFAHLEQALQERTTQLHDTLQKQLAGVEKTWHERLARLEESLNDERLERSSAQERLAGELDHTEGKLRETISTLGHHVDVTFEHLDNARQKDSEALRQELGSLAKQFQHDLEQAVKDLQDQKTDRRALAALLTNLAQQLVPRGAD